MAYIYACHLSISLCHHGEHVEWRQLMTYFHMIRPEVKEQIPSFKIKYKYKSYQGYTNKMSMSDDEASTTLCWTGSLLTLPHHLDLITVMTNNYEIYETRSLGPLLNHMSGKKRWTIELPKCCYQKDKRVSNGKVVFQNVVNPHFITLGKLCYTKAFCKWLFSQCVRNLYRYIYIYIYIYIGI